MLKVWGISYPTLTFFAITLTGNHYIVDAIGGALVALLSLLIYNGLVLWWGRTRKPERAPKRESESRGVPSRGRAATA